MNVKDVNLLCRTCLKSRRNCSSIYSRQPFDEEPIYEVINYVYDLEITMDDGLPKHICQKCLATVKLFESYKRDAHKVRKDLMLLMEKNQVFLTVKEECLMDSSDLQDPLEVNSENLKDDCIFIDDDQLQDSAVAEEGNEATDATSDAVLAGMELELKQEEIILQNDDMNENESRSPSGHGQVEREKQTVTPFTRKLNSEIDVGLSGIEETVSVLIPEATLNPELKAFIAEKTDELSRELKSHMGALATEMKDRLDSLKGLVQKAVPMAKVPAEFPPEIRGLNKLPSKTLEGLAKFDEDLKRTADYRSYMLTYLRDRSSNVLCWNVGDAMFSAAVNRTVNEVCACIMTNALASSICLTKRNLSKVSMEENFPNIITLIYGAVKNKDVTGRVDLATVKRSMSEWLRQARNRSGGLSVESS